jgi:excisionase family DNA binding protein
MNILSMQIKRPSNQERGIAKQSLKRIEGMHRIPKKTALNLDGLSVELPVSAVKLIFSILNEMAEGNSLTLIPSHAHLTTQEGADMLNVSRPYFVKLLEEGKIPFEKVGTRRRVLASDVKIFMNKSLDEREKALQKLIDQAQELNMGY